MFWFFLMMGLISIGWIWLICKFAECDDTTYLNVKLLRRYHKLIRSGISVIKAENEFSAKVIIETHYIIDRISIVYIGLDKGDDHFNKRLQVVIHEHIEKLVAAERSLMLEKKVKNHIKHQY